MVLLIIVGLVGLYILGGQESTGPANPGFTVDSSQESQQRRAELLAELQANGVFAKIEIPGKYPRVYVTPAFYLLAIDDKEAFVKVVFAYHYSINREREMVLLVDNLNGKQVGTYSPRFGLDLD